MNLSDSVVSLDFAGRDLAPLAPGQAGWGAVAAGTVLGGSYRLTRRLAQGGMGDIYLASHERLPGVFVVKVLSAELAHDPDAFIRFQREAIVMTAIRHPNVVQVVDFNSTPDGMPYLVMEYLQGRDLAEILAERRALEPPDISRVVRNVACGLDAAHRLGIVHRDLKPENIMVVPCPGQADIIKLIDFGISKARRFGPVTSTSTVIGTPEFMSPEQAQGKQEDVDARSDQFALAVISYLLLTGRTPWGSAEPVETLHRVVNSPPLPLATHLVGSFASVEAVLFRAMAKKPSDRYPSSLAFARALDRAFVMDGLLADTAVHETASSGSGFHTVSSATEDLRPGSREPGTARVEPVDARMGSEGPSAVHATRAAGEPLAPRESMRDQVGNPAEVAATEHPTPPSGVRESGVSPPRTRRRQRRRLRYAWEGGVLLLALVCGTSIGFLDAPTVRTHTLRGLGAMRALLASVERSATAGMHNLSSAWRGAGALADDGSHH